MRDFEPMQERVRHMGELARQATAVYSPQEVGETVDFVDWLLQLNFVLLGYREYRMADGPEGRTIQAVPGSGLGILADVSSSAFSDATPLNSLDPDVRRRIEEGELLVITKTKAYSTVHRRARMDYVGVRIVSPEGQVVGEARLIGLFTSKAYMEPAAKTPLLHHKLEQIIAAEDLIPGSHDYKQVIELFESFPRDELFQASTEELRGLVVGLLQLEKHGGIRVLLRKDLYGRQVSIVVALPRERFSATLRKRLQEMFRERFGGSSVDYHLSLGETESARIFFTVHVETGVQIPEIPYEELEEEVERLARTWDDDLLDSLTEILGPERGPALAARYGPRFPDYYKTTETDWNQVAMDVVSLEQLASDADGFVIGIGERERRRATDPRQALQDRRQGRPVGVHAAARVAGPARGRGDPDRPARRGARLHPRLRRARCPRRGAEPRGRGRPGARGAQRDVAGRGRGGLAEPARDLRGPVLAPGAHPARVSQVPDARVRRASPRSTATTRLPRTRTSRAASSELFEAKFDPVRQAPAADADAIRQQIKEDLRSVASLDQDQIVRSLLGTIEATVRTNAYLPERPALAFKLRSADVPEMPKPFPLYEIFVYSPQMEAIHLRGGMVARGGIRWSDRKEDYRTEVLGLMKAQRVKNAVIVPDGSKGGFILKRSHELARRAEAGGRRPSTSRSCTGCSTSPTTCVHGEVTHPEGVRVLDGDDPYLVVAADKGTATFSDTANAGQRGVRLLARATRSRPAAARGTTTRRSASPRAAPGSR